MITRHAQSRSELYTLPEVPRTEFGREQVSRCSDFRDLWNSLCSKSRS